jgi:hypothetical protein
VRLLRDVVLGTIELVAVLLDRDPIADWAYGRRASR